MRRPLTKTETEIIVKKSRFIAIAMPIQGLDEVKEKTALVRSWHPDATHVVHAAVAGDAGTLWSCSDDREPKNTAGRPALEVLKGSGLTDIIVCVVRYFGGTLLGTGGLVKAYGDSVKAVLPLIESEEVVARRRFTVRCGYDAYERIRRALPSYDITGLEEDFAEGVAIMGSIREEEAGAFEEAVSSLSLARATFRWLG